MTVVITTYLRDRRGRLQNIRDVETYKASKDYVEGVVALSIHGAVIISEQDWDDINFLWPDMVQAAEECRNTGAGETVLRRPAGPVPGRAPAGGPAAGLAALGEQRRAASVDAGEFHRALAAAGLEYFAFERRCLRGEATDEPAVLQRWLDAG